MLQTYKPFKYRYLPITNPFMIITKRPNQQLLLEVMQW